MNNMFAFPVTQQNMKSEGGEDGMTLRDYFAAKAMQFLIKEWTSIYGDNKTGISERSYEMADAMLKERNKNE